MPDERNDGMFIEWFQRYKKIVIACLFAVGMLTYGIVGFISHDSEMKNSDAWLEEQPPIEANGEEEENVEVMVDVKGAVHQPGVYKAVKGERVIDLIDRAGGLTTEAAEKMVNFALHVADEMVIYIPTKEEELEGAPPTVTAIAGDGFGGVASDLVNINKAEETELQTLTGIGPAKAIAIIEYRNTNGAFQTIDELKQVSGIGDKTFEKLRDQICVK